MVTPMGPLVGMPRQKGVLEGMSAIHQSMEASSGSKGFVIDAIRENV